MKVNQFPILKDFIISFCVYPVWLKIVLGWLLARIEQNNKRWLLLLHILTNYSRLNVHNENQFCHLGHFFPKLRIIVIKVFDIKDFFGYLLFYIGFRVLVPDSRLLFEASLHHYKIPNFNALLDFPTYADSS